MYAPTGDEPHYIVIANSVWRYHGFETTSAYRDAFHSPMLPTPGQEPGPGNTHAELGPNGLFSIHNIGLPLLIALPLQAFGVYGAKSIMVLLASGIAILAYQFSGFYSRAPGLRLLLGVALSCSAPFLPAAGQIYPDLLAGVLFGIVLLHVAGLALDNPISQTGILLPALAAGAIAFAPWLQIKFSAASVVSLIGCISWCGQRRWTLIHRICFFATPFLVSILSLGFYNHYAFGNIFGPYESGSLVVGMHALVVLIGLHLDQFQGIFFLCPLLLLAAVGLPALVRHETKFGVFFLVLYASLVLPNAMHPNWYGGSSFAGRFIWTGSALLLLPAVFALRILRPAVKLVVALCVVSLCIQAYFYSEYMSSSFNLYNQPLAPFIESYVSLYAPFQRYFPQLINMNWVFYYAPNYGWLAALLGLLVIGWASARPNPGRLGNSRLAALAVLSVLPLVIGTAAAALWQPEGQTVLIYQGSDLPGIIGHISGTTRVASPTNDPAGFLSFGPYVNLPKGNYQFDVVYSSDAPSNQVVGYRDIVNNSGVLSKPTNLTGTDGHSTTERISIDIAGATDGVLVQIRTFFEDVSKMTIESVVIRRM